jgi:hypothetical protein
MEVCSIVVTPRLILPAGMPQPESSAIDLVGACLVKAFPIDPSPMPPMNWGGRPVFSGILPAERHLLAPLPAAQRAMGADAGAPDPEPAASDADADADDRRSEDRSKVSVYRSAMLRWNRVEALCLIRNVSSGGMMGKVLLDLPIGTAVLVEMRSGHDVAGRVVWARDQLVGVQFDDMIDVQQVINGAHRVRPAWRQRMPRVHVPCPVTLITNNGRQTVKLLDLSQGGAKIEGEQLREGEDVTLAVKGLEPHRGTVRWTQGDCAGIAFFTAIPFDALAIWALDRQSELGLIGEPQDEPAAKAG